MIMAAVRNGWIEYERIMFETLTSIRRASDRSTAPMDIISIVEPREAAAGTKRQRFLYACTDHALFRPG